HEGVMVVEVMGRYTGWIALNSGVSGGADVLLIPIDVLKVGDAIRTRERSGREFSIVVVAEGAIAHHGRQILREAKEVGREPRLGGIGEWLAVEIAAHTGKETQPRPRPSAARRPAHQLRPPPRHPLRGGGDAAGRRPLRDDGGPRSTEGRRGAAGQGRRSR